MAFEIQKNDNYTLVRVTGGKLDVSNAPELKSELILLNSRGENHIVLDLAECSYCDSSGLRAILAGNRLCEHAIGTFILSNLQPEVEKIIRLSLLHTALLITKTVEEAAALLQKKSTL
jgi:anti-sigma B factor antagonist